jgi:hypothetical protein
MKIQDLYKQTNFEDADLKDDLMFFMYSDDKFYRRMLFPVIHDFRQKMKSQKGCEDVFFRSCVDQACKIYCKKFDIKGNEKSVFTDVDRDEVARKIFGQEKQEIERAQ